LTSGTAALGSERRSLPGRTPQGRAGRCDKSET